MKIDLTPNDVALLTRIADERVRDNTRTHDERLRAAITEVRNKLGAAYIADYERRHAGKEPE